MLNLKASHKSLENHNNNLNMERNTLIIKSHWQSAELDQYQISLMFMLSMTFVEVDKYLDNKCLLLITYFASNFTQENMQRVCGSDYKFWNELNTTTNIHYI